MKPFAKKRFPRAKKISAPVIVPDTYPMRINKYLALQGIATRRSADELIEKGVVSINGVRAQVGDKVHETDVVKVRENTKKHPYVYIAFHKPKGMDTHKEVTGAPNVPDSLPADIKRLGLFPIGRLDKESHGLLLLTNDGRVTDRLLNPKYGREKVYDVHTKQPLRSSAKEKLEAGVNIEGYQTKPAKVQILGSHRLRITITEGKSHQVRRMMVALFNEVKDLKRESIMNIRLGSTKRGEYRVVEGKELETFLTDLGLAQPSSTAK